MREEFEFKGHKLDEFLKLKYEAMLKKEFIHDIVFMIDEENNLYLKNIDKVTMRTALQYGWIGTIYGIQLYLYGV